MVEALAFRRVSAKNRGKMQGDTPALGDNFTA
jgi:hypothetical protein